MYTKQEAIKLMHQGHKLTHHLFSQSEYIWIDKFGTLRDEMTYNISKEFWLYRQDEVWLTGWSIFIEK